MKGNVKRCYGYAHFEKPGEADDGDYFVFPHYNGQWLIVKGTIAAEKYITPVLEDALVFSLAQAQIRGRKVWLRRSEQSSWKAVDERGFESEVG